MVRVASRLERSTEFLLTRRPVTLVCGLGVLLAPTVFTLFPGLTQWQRLPRLLVMAAWLLAAIIAVLGALRQSGQLDALVLPRVARVTQAAQVATSMLIQTMLTHHGFAGHYRFQLFLLNEELGLLEASYDSQGIKEAPVWEVGKGVTGRAWKTESYQIATGEDCFSAKWGLSMRQQETYQHLRVVAAQPVFADDGRTVIAILTGSSTDNDGELASPDGVDRQRLLASVIARVLSDIQR